MTWLDSVPESPISSDLEINEGLNFLHLAASPQYELYRCEFTPVAEPDRDLHSVQKLIPVPRGMTVPFIFNLVSMISCAVLKNEQ